MADCEKEREMKETLQHCVKALKLDNVQQAVRNGPSHRSREDSSGRQQKPCHFYMKEEGCRNRDHCRFLHGDLSRPNEIPSNNRPRSSANNARKCRFFNRVGGCRNADSCRFLHVPRPVCKWHPNCTNRRCSFNHTAVNFQASQPVKPPDMSNPGRTLPPDNNNPSIAGNATNNFITPTSPASWTRATTTSQQGTISDAPNQQQPAIAPSTNRNGHSHHLQSNNYSYMNNNQTAAINAQQISVQQSGTYPTGNWMSHPNYPQNAPQPWLTKPHQFNQVHQQPHWSQMHQRQQQVPQQHTMQPMHHMQSVSLQAHQSPISATNAVTMQPFQVPRNYPMNPPNHMVPQMAS